ncbi:MAG: hypothetical protein AAF518_27765, partial [Spirochaetota bacterium]
FTSSLIKKLSKSKDSEFNIEQIVQETYDELNNHDSEKLLATKIAGGSKITKKNLQSINEKDFYEYNRMQWDQLTMSYGTRNLKLPATRKEIIQFKNACKGGLDKGMYPLLSYKGPEKGLLIFDLKDENDLKNLTFEEQVLDQIEKLARYAIESGDKSFLCKPAFIISWDLGKLRLKTLNLRTMFSYYFLIRPTKGKGMQDSEEARIDFYTGKIKNNPNLHKYLQIQWLIGTEETIDDLLNQLRKCSRSSIWYIDLNCRIDLLINDGLDAEMLMEGFEKMKGKLHPNDKIFKSIKEVTGKIEGIDEDKVKTRYDLVKFYLNKAIKKKCFVGSGSNPDHVEVHPIEVNEPGQYDPIPNEEEEEESSNEVQHVPSESYELAHKIDTRFGKYYQCQGEKYYDNNDKGKFLLCCEENGFNTENIQYQLNGDIKNCRFLDFDKNFPFPPVIKSEKQKQSFIFNLIKEIVSRENNSNPPGAEEIKGKEPGQPNPIPSEQAQEKSSNDAQHVHSESGGLIHKMDTALNSYYQSQGKDDYLNDNNKGKFESFCDEEGFDSEGVRDELNAGSNDCLLVGFDDDFPLTNSITKETDKEKAIYRIIKGIYRAIQKRSDTASNSTDSVSPSSMHHNNSHRSEELPPTKIVGTLRITEKDVPPNEYNTSQLDQLTVSFDGLEKSDSIKLSEGIQEIIIFRYIYEKNRCEGIYPWLSRNGCELGPVIFDLGNRRYEMLKNNKVFGKINNRFAQLATVLSEIKKLAYYAIESGDESFLCKPVFIISYEEDKLKLQTLHPVTILNFYFQTFPDYHKYMENAIEEKMDFFYSEIKNDVRLHKYLQIQWLLNPKRCIEDLRYQLREFGYPDSKLQQKIRYMIDLLINDRLDAKVLREKFRQMKENNRSSDWCDIEIEELGGKTEYGYLLFLVNKIIKEKRLGDVLSPMPQKKEKFDNIEHIYPTKVCGAVKIRKEDLKAPKETLGKLKSEPLTRHKVSFRVSEERKSCLIYGYLRKMGIWDNKLLQVLIDLIKEYWWYDKYQHFTHSFKLSRDNIQQIIELYNYYECFCDCLLETETKKPIARVILDIRELSKFGDEELEFLYWEDDDDSEKEQSLVCVNRNENAKNILEKIKSLKISREKQSICMPTVIIHCEGEVTPNK